MIYSAVDYERDDALLEPIIHSHISNNSHNNLNGLLTLNELAQALKKTKSKAIGSDLIHNEMLQNVSSNSKNDVLLLFNVLYSNAFVPDVWKRAIVIPLPKPGKLTYDANSYRTISFTSCLSKLFKRVITNRLSWFVEHNNLLGPEQAGFRKQRCTIKHNIVKLDLEIKSGFKAKKSTVTLFLDISKAYESVWTNGLFLNSANWDFMASALAGSRISSVTALSVFVKPSLRLQTHPYWSPARCRNQPHPV